MRRLVAAAVLFEVAGAALLLTVFPILELFDDYKDSPDSLYIVWARSPRWWRLPPRSAGLSCCETAEFLRIEAV